MFSSFRILALLTTVPTVWVPAVCQGGDESHIRADGFRALTRNKVFRDRVDAHWIEGEPRRFWYKIATGRSTHRFILVDAEKGQRTDAFDHGQLASSLAEASGQVVAGDALPMAALDFSNDSSSLEFSAFAKRWTYRFEGADLSVIEPGGGGGGAGGSSVRILDSLRAERFTGEDTSITFVNDTGGTLGLYWVNNADNPKHYHNIEPGERLEQHTFGGHVWLAEKADGSPAGIYQAVRSPGVAVIDGSWKPKEIVVTPGEPKKSRGVESPDGKWRAEIRNDNIGVTNTKTGEYVFRSGDGHQDDRYLERFWWSPDSRKLVVMRERPGENRRVTLVESSPEDQLQPKVHSFTYEKPGDRIAMVRPVLFAVGGGTVRAVPVDDGLFPDPWSISKIRWAEDSDHFTFLYNKRGHQVMRLISVDADSGEPRAIISEEAETFFCYSSKTYLHHLPKTDEIIWMSERDGWNHLYLYDAEAGEVKNQITVGNWAVRGVTRVDPAARQIWFRAGGIVRGQSPYHVHHARIGFDGSGLTLLSEGDGTHDVEFSPDGEYYIDRFSRVDQPPVTELRRAADGGLVCGLESGEWSELLAAGWKVPERFVAKGRDGETDIHGVIFRPTNFDPGKRYPVVEQIYAGPHSAHVPVRFSPFHGAQVTAELGFVVVQIDGMGTSHRSKAFHDVCWKNLGDAGFPDRIAWMEAAAASRPWMDLERVGIYGGSAGGQNAMGALIWHHDFYDVAVADCGCHDNRMDKIWWNEQWMGFPVGPEYSGASNVDNAHLMEGKLLLIVGELDRNVDPASTLQVADALVRADKHFELLVIPGEGHGAAGTPYGQRRQREFLIRHLLGAGS